MSIKILMPALSPTMTEGNLAKWHVKEGDQVNPGDVIAEIETDKATMEVESIDEGIVGKILVAEGTEAVPVNQTIGILLEEGEDASAADSASEAPAANSPAAEAAEAAAPLAKDAPPAEAAPEATPAPSPAAAGADVKASPLAKRIAEQSGVDLGSVEGSGAHGKVVRADVEAAISGGGSPAAGGSVEISATGALPTAVDAGGNRIHASPLARRMAAQAGLDLSTVQGSGPDGRIVKRDVAGAVAKGVPAAAEAAADVAPAEATAAAAPVAGDTSELVKLSTMRKVIAQRMAESKSQVPHFYLTVDCELDELLSVRKALNAAQEDVKISVNDFVIRACAMALMEVPAANVAYEGEGVMRQFHTADISVAVAIPGGLITPIVRAAEAKGFKQISADMKDLATRARDGKLAPEEYQGGSFSVSNLGMFGVKQFDAVINPPQACILAVGAGEQRPVVKDGQVVPATVMSCTLSVDHRVVDGAIGAELLAAIKRYIETPALMLL
jgi:pyruvate dehydrogenase E2 component (dihydrolipoamide acetyltransferase)